LKGTGIVKTLIMHAAVIASKYRKKQGEPAYFEPVQFSGRVRACKPYYMRRNRGQNEPGRGILVSWP
jgi:hypothetical protein